VAPHSPYHTPPDPTTYSQSPVNNNTQRFIAMIEAMDFEIGRLLDNIDPAVRANTTIIFVGDNGTPNQVLQNYPTGQSKGSIYQGGVHVPMFVSGAKVTRQSEWDESLINVTDIYSTVLELAGTDLDGGIYNSFSFLPQLQSDSPEERKYNFTINESDNPARSGYTIRNDRYKLLKFEDGHDEFYDLWLDSLELVDIISSASLATVVNELEQEATQILNDWSCQDMIKNGSEIAVDCGTSTCGQCSVLPTFSDCNEESINICDDIAIDTFVIAESEIIDSHTVTSELAYFQAKDCVLLAEGFAFEGDVFEVVMDDCGFDGIDDPNCTTFNDLNFANIGCGIAPSFPSEYAVTINGLTREITTNNYPNHNHDANMANNVPSPMNYVFEVDKDPVLANITTSILNNSNRPRYFFGVAVNGVIFAPAPAAPFIFTNTATGEYNYNWIFEPTNNSGVGQQWVSLDCAAAHTGPQGYHYHGNMIEYLETDFPGSTTATTAPTDPIHIGWAADGFPILYRFGPDANGNLTLLQQSYRLKPGLRPGDGVSAPCGSYNGKYTVDYEYVSCLGDLDECNGVERQVTIPTAEGSKTFDYFYVITDSFPQISRCFKGTPDVSFR
jgi:hypothetical protein